MHAVIVFLSTFVATAAQAAAEPPPETAGPGAVIAFLVVFAVLVAGYVWMTMRSSKKENDAKKDAT